MSRSGSSGSVEVTSEDGKTVIQTLSDGDFFGELALLHSKPRIATVRAVGYWDLYTLDRESFAQTLAQYPDFAAHIDRISQERAVPRGDSGNQAGGSGPSSPTPT